MFCTIFFERSDKICPNHSQFIYYTPAQQKASERKRPIYGSSELPDASSSNTQAANCPHASSQRIVHTPVAAAILNADGVSPTSSNTQSETPAHPTSPLPAAAILKAKCPSNVSPPAAVVVVILNQRNPCVPAAAAVIHRKSPDASGSISNTQ